MFDSCALNDTHERREEKDESIFSPPAEGEAAVLKR